MEIRIKEYLDGPYIRYKVQYKWLGIFWREYYDYFDKYAAICAAKVLESQNYPRYWTWQELEKSNVTTLPSRRMDRES